MLSHVFRRFFGINNSVFLGIKNKGVDGSGVRKTFCTDSSVFLQTCGTEGALVVRFKLGFIFRRNLATSFGGLL